MRRFLLALMLVLCYTGVAIGQTTVNLTVQDTPDNQLWNNGTWAVKLQQAAGNSSQTNTFTLLSGGGSLAAQSGSLSGTATASISLPPNANIGPGGTTWQFTVCPQASAACWQQSVTVSTSSPQTLAINPPSIRINLATATPPISAYATGEVNGAVIGSQFFLIGTGQQFCSAVTGNLCTSWSSSGSGISQVSSLPALPCTANAVVNLTTGAQGVYTCIGGVWVQSPEGGSTVFAASYGVTAAGSEDCLATFTNGSGTVTLSANAVTPTASMVGWSMQGSVGCLDGLDSNVMPRCTITSINSGSRTLTGTGCSANVNATGTATQHVVFGPIEDTPLAAAETAGLASNTGPCPNFQLPSGFVYVVNPHFNTITCNTQYTGSFSTGLQVQGYGRVSSRLMMSQDFAFASCPSFNGVNSCFFAKNGITKQNMSITGGQNTGSNPAAATCIINDGIDDFTFNFGIYGYGHTLTSINGHCITGGGTTDSLIIEDGMGATGELIQLSAGGVASFLQSFWGNNNQVAFNWLSGGSKVVTVESGYNTSAATTGIVQIAVGAGGTWISQGDNIINPVVGSNYTLCNAGSVCAINGMSTFGTISGALNAFAVSSGAGHYLVSNSRMSSGPTGFMWNLASSTAIGDDMGGNVFTDTAGQVVNLTAGASLRRINPTSTYTNVPGPGLASCASSAAPAVCSSWFDGAVAVPAASTTLTVNTTAVTADSEITLQVDSTLGTKLGAITCNTTFPAIPPSVTTRTPGTSFVITTTAPVTNPLCISFTIK